MTWWQIVVLVLFLAAVVYYTVKVIRPGTDAPPPAPRPTAAEPADPVGPTAREDAG